jgi:hypothetical protein
MRLLPLLVAVVALAAGCGGDDADRGSPGAGTPVPGGVLTVEQALAYEGDEPVLVSGHVLARDGEVRLCSGFAESHPPQCADPSLAIEGLAVSNVANTRSAGGVTWTDGAIELPGRVSGTTLVVSDTAP